MTELSIRRATPGDFPAIAEILNALWPDQFFTASGLQHDEDSQQASPLPLKRGRWMAELGGRPVGFAEFDQYAGMYHPQKFSAALNVHPEEQRRGFGRVLAGHLWAELAPFHPLSVTAGTQDDCPRGLDFLARQGFAEVMRYFESRLQVPAFDFAPFTAQEAMPGGYRLAHLAELGQGDATLRHVYALWSEVRLDVPRPEPGTPLPFEQFVKRFEDPAYLLPEGYLIAVLEESGEYAAVSELWKSDGPHLDTGLTGVRREHRRKGLALSLKLAAIRVAQGLGVPEIRTGNASNNAGMLSINEQLGFVRQVAWIESQWKRTLQPG